MGPKTMMSFVRTMFCVLSMIPEVRDRWLATEVYWGRATHVLAAIIQGQYKAKALLRGQLSSFYVGGGGHEFPDISILST